MFNIELTKNFYLQVRLLLLKTVNLHEEGRKENRANQNRERTLLFLPQSVHHRKHQTTEIERFTLKLMEGKGSF